MSDFNRAEVILEGMLENGDWIVTIRDLESKLALLKSDALAGFDAIEIQSEEEIQPGDVIKVCGCICCLKHVR